MERRIDADTRLVIVELLADGRAVVGEHDLVFRGRLLQGAVQPVPADVVHLGVLVGPEEMSVVPYLTAVVHAGLQGNVADRITDCPQGCSEHLGVIQKNGPVVKVSDVRPDHMFVAGKGILQRDAVPLLVPADHTHIVFVVAGDDDGLPEVVRTPVKEGVAFHLPVLKVDDVAGKKEDVPDGIKEAIGVYEL